MSLSVWALGRPKGMQTHPVLWDLLNKSVQLVGSIESGEKRSLLEFT